MDVELERLAQVAVDCGFRLHDGLGPGLLESVYEACLSEALTRRRLRVARQRVIPVIYDGVTIDEGFRLDLLVEDRLVIEVRSTERFAPIHGKQVLTYLRLMDLPLGLLMNFGAPTFRDGCRRIANNYYGRIG